MESGFVAEVVILQASFLNTISTHFHTSNLTFNLSDTFLPLLFSSVFHDSVSSCNWVLHILPVPSHLLSSASVVFSALSLSEAIEDYSGELTLTGSQTAPADSSFPLRAPGLGQG